MGKKNKDKKNKKSFKRTAIEILICIAVIFGVVFYITHTYIRPAIVEGESMYPTFSEGDIIFIDLKAYENDDPERFDLIVFPYDSYSNYIKRIIAMPGETVMIQDGKIYINGTEINEYYGYEDYIEEAYEAETVIRLDDDEYFVLGDNRNNSVDSRYLSVGPIERDEIIGKAVYRIWPLNAFGSLENQ